MRLIKPYIGPGGVARGSRMCCNRIPSFLESFMSYVFYPTPVLFKSACNKGRFDRQRKSYGT